MTTAWRICKAKLSGTAFTGEGAFLYGGRWNSPGVRMVYLAQSPSLATLEMLVHLDASELLAAYRLCEAVFDDRLVETLDPATLPKNWRRSPAPVALQRLGDEWTASMRSAVLRVPSAIVPGESNYLLNPAHPDSTDVTAGKMRPYEFDPRLAK